MCVRVCVGGTEHFIGFFKTRASSAEGWREEAGGPVNDNPGAVITPSLSSSPSLSLFLPFAPSLPPLSLSLPPPGVIDRSGLLSD